MLINMIILQANVRIDSIGIPGLGLKQMMVVQLSGEPNATES